MLRKYGTNFACLLYLLDLGWVLLALWIAQRLRILLPLSGPISERAAHVPEVVYLLAVGLFAVVLPLPGLYDPHRTVRFTDETQRVILAVAIGSLALASSPTAGFPAWSSGTP
ncbi:MAG: hypothetical protein N0A24_09285 [Armatimonadetes bacterium]|nr:hypothetical protein [Armatimonadota bacterium]MDW8154380.1 hypothetical protein [Armatimonadota bacterium]